MMKYQEFVECIEKPCAILAAAESEDGRPVITVECGNEAFIRLLGSKFVPGMRYGDLVPADSKFEEYCIDAALRCRPRHAYVRGTTGSSWTDFTMIPLHSDEEGRGYCAFSFEFTEKAEPERMADVSVDTASTVIRNCITLMGTDDFVSNVRSVLTDILDVSQARSCRIMLLNDEKKEAINFCEVLTDKIPQNAIPGSGQIPYDVVKSWERMIGSGDSVVFNGEKGLDELEKHAPALVQMMRRNHTTSLVMIPLRRGNKILGFMYVINFNTDNVDQIKELLELMAFFLGSEISNYQLVNKLRRMSSEDALTGLLNRNAMKKRIEELIHDNKGASVGIINMDINGLKEVNDLQGHDAGDELLKHAADVMKDIFEEGEIYRSGGDEFIAIVAGGSQEDFDRKIEKLHEADHNDPEFSIAVGSYWAENGVEDSRTAFLHADESMYIDKREFYRRHPEKNRREGR